MNNEAPINAANEFSVPIKLIDPDICMSCPDLEIVNHQMEMWTDGMKIICNRLSCRYFERCKNLVDSITKNHHA